MPRVQFQLRTLLLVTLLIGCGFGWWFRPYTIKEYWPHGGLRSQLSVRRSWQGEITTSGTQSWWWSNGQLAAQGQSYGRAIGPHSRRLDWPLDLSQGEYYNEAGDPIGYADLLIEVVMRHRVIGPSTTLISEEDRFPETPFD